MAATNATSATAGRGANPAHELDAPPWLRVESTLMATANAIRDEYDVRLAPIGLNLSTASLLSYIGEFGPVSQTRAAEHLGQGRAVTGTQVDKLEALGLVQRLPDPADRRVWLVAITDPGRELAAAVAEIDAVLRTDLRDGISRSDRQTLATLLVRLHQNIRSHHGSSHRSPDQPSNQRSIQPSNQPSNQETEEAT
jgi:MarR family transcriptional regulator for hemolysin